MQKTPVSILQEMMVKKGVVPNYELIHDGGGSHENTFTYRVLSDGLRATGTGRCKKDAKHAAAKNMLDEMAKRNGLLPLPASPADSPVRTPLPKPMPAPHILPPNEPFVNAIGELQDICAENELGEVVYETVSDVGPPHARIFTIQCYVSSFKEEGIATTKKQAKHVAAGKMYARIKGLVDNAEYIPKRTENSADEPTENAANNEDIIDKYKRLFPFHRKANLGVKMSEYHKKLNMNYDATFRAEIIEKLNVFGAELNDVSADEWIDKYLDEIVNAFEEILANMKVEVQYSFLRNEKSDFILALHLDTTPEIMVIHSDEDKCRLAKTVVLRTIDKLKIFLV